MSQIALHLKSGFAAAPLANGIGRFVPQCQRITLKFCFNSGGSKGVRDFIQEHLVEYARAHPATVIYLKPRRHRSAVIVAEYLNGGREWMTLHNMECKEVRMWVEACRTQAGYGPMHFRNYQSTQIPSIQGVWTPLTHKSPNRNILHYPEESLNNPPLAKPSTTEIVQKLFGNSAEK